MSPADFRCGLAGLLGRPNVGKSTLLNALVGSEVAIASDRPQTTRKTLRGVINWPDAQIILVDAPGIHKPKNLLGQRLNALVSETFFGLDLLVVCYSAAELVGRGDRFIADKFLPEGLEKLAVITKVDLVKPARLLPQIQAVSQLAEFAEIVPVSAKSGLGLEDLTRQIIRLLPRGPALYPGDFVSDEPVEERFCETIRHQALAQLREELPHSVAVRIDEVIEGGVDQILKIYASLYIERNSQKPIVLGSGGARLRKIALQSRKIIESGLGRRAFLSIRVRVAKDWQKDPNLLRKLGF